MVTAGLVKELRERTGAGMLDCKKALEANDGNLEVAIDWLREKGISKAAKKSDRIAAEGIAAILEKNNRAVIVEVNSETDFVAKNEEFTNLVEIILNTLVNSEVKTLDDGLNLPIDNVTLNDLIVEKTAKIGEKLELRRFEIIEKTSEQVFGSYIHMGGKIAVLTLLDKVDESVAKDVAMHIAAMSPTYIRREQIPNDVIEKERIILKEQAVNEGKNEDVASKMVEGRIQKFYKETCLEEQPFIKDSDISVLKYVQNNNGSIVNMIRYKVGEGIEKRNEDFACEVMSQIKKQD